MGTDAQPKFEDTPEATGTFFGNLLGWFEKLTKLRKYWATRKCIIQGENLFDLPSGVLAKRNLMGPLTFNAYESTLSGASASFLGWFITLLFPIEPKAPVLPENVSEFARAWVLEAGKVAPEVMKTASPFLPPLLLLFGAWVAGWACLKGRDSNKHNRRRCRNAYLYYDGAWGLLPEGALAIAVALGVAASLHGWDSARLIAAVAVPAAIGVGYSFYLGRHKFPRLLFALNGYDQKVYYFWHRHKPENRAPWSKYSLATWTIGGIGAWVFLALMIEIITLVSWGIAYVTVLLRLWVQHRL
jgi:hypothetical protein